MEEVVTEEEFTVFQIESNASPAAEVRGALNPNFLNFTKILSLRNALVPFLKLTFVKKL